MSSDAVKLSKNVLQMKFMQRSVLRMEEEQNEEEKQRVIDDEHWVLDLPHLTQREERFVPQPSYTGCEDFLFGRMSFKEFNPEMEKLMKLHNPGTEEEDAEEKETAVTATEMANRYSALVGLIGKKFTTKKRRSGVLDEEEKDNAAEMIDDDDDDDTEQLINLLPKTKKSRKFLKPDDS
ncbi:hypothetical protein ACOMHN_040536 [Nucella lapillus]